MINSQPIRSSNPALNVLKNVGASTLFLVATILTTASTVLGGVTAFMGNSIANQFVGQFMNYSGMSYSDLAPYLNLRSGPTASTVISVIIGMVPSILICVGMWLTWATCRNMTSGNISTTGLTMCKVILIIYRVLIIIALVVLVIGGIFLIVVGASARGWSYDYATGMREDFGPFALSMSIIGILAVTLGVLTFALALCFYISAGRAVNRIRQTATTGVPDNRISMFLIVMLWIIGIFSALSALSTAILSPIMAVSGLIGAASQIVIALCLKKYRDEMTLLMPAATPYAQPYQQPVYPQQPVQPYQQAPQQYPQQPYGQQPVQPYQQPAVPQQPVQPYQQAHQQYPQQPYGQQPVQSYQQPAVPQQPAQPVQPAPQQPQEPVQPVAPQEPQAPQDGNDPQL